MYRQLNSASEMGRRLGFLIYIACAAVFAIELVVFMARPGWRDLMVSVGALSLAAGLRRIAYLRRDFERLVESFPSGCALDMVPEPVRLEVERLVAEFRAPGSGWVRRTEIRHRLLDLEQEQPEIIEAYSDELRAVFAA